jgi:hypothetical protein
MTNQPLPDPQAEQRHKWLVTRVQRSESKVGIEESARHNLFGINILRKFLKKEKTGLTDSGNLLFSVDYGKAEEGGDCIQEESARATLMHALITKLINPIRNDLICAPACL